MRAPVAAAAALALLAAPAFADGAAPPPTELASVSLGNLDRCIGLIHKGAADEGRACLKAMTGNCARMLGDDAPADERESCARDEAAAWQGVVDAHAEELAAAGEAGADPMLERRFKLLRAVAMGNVDEVCDAKPEGERDSCRARGLSTAAINLRYDHLGVVAGMKDGE